MNKAMVLRAGSALGRALVERLKARGMETIAVSKPGRKSPHELTVAAEGVDVIFYSAYLRYDDEPKKIRRMTEAVMEAASRTGAKVVRIEGIYSPAGEHESLEDTNRHPSVSVLRIHCPELYGASVKNTILHYSLKKLAQGKKITTWGDPDVLREYVYLPDAASRIVELATEESAYGRFWNIRSADTVSLAELISIAGAAVGIKPRLEPVGGWKLRLLQGYDSRIEGLLNRYDVATQPRSEEDRLVFTGAAPATPYEAGVVETVKSMIPAKSKPAAAD